MAFVLAKSTTKSDKGQRSDTTSVTNVTKSGTTNTVTAPRTDQQTAQGAVRLEIAFTMRFRHASPTTPAGETEPTPTC
jgi:hypothetical protein